MGQSRTIRKITEVQNIPAANVSGISSDRAYVIIQVDSKGAGDNTRKLYNNNNQYRLKIEDVLKVASGSLPVVAAGTVAPGELYVDSTSGAVSVQQ